MRHKRAKAKTKRPMRQGDSTVITEEGHIEDNTIVISDNDN